MPLKSLQAVSSAQPVAIQRKKPEAVRHVRPGNLAARQQALAQYARQGNLANLLPKTKVPQAAVIVPRAK